MTGSSCCVPQGPHGPAGCAAAAVVAPAAPPPHPIGGWCEIPAGRFLMGNEGADAVPGDGEGPVREIVLPAFRIGSTAVTNAQFAAFVRATRFMTEAEACGASFVFHLQLDAATQRCPPPAVYRLPWWRQVEDACWQRPEGPGSHVRDRPGHPVVHVSWNDAQAYCEWAGCRLPDEAEWERAARGGLEGMRYAWGDALLDAAGEPRCNVFRGAFPDSPAPDWKPGPIDAAAGEANGFGLFNVCGNVWEWCSDTLADRQRPLRGGSFLCHDSYCNRYRVAARTGNSATTSASNIGFRVCRAA